MSRRHEEGPPRFPNLGRNIKTGLRRVRIGVAVLAVGGGAVKGCSAFIEANRPTPPTTSDSALMVTNVTPGNDAVELRLRNVTKRPLSVTGRMYVLDGGSNTLGFHPDIPADQPGKVVPNSADLTFGVLQPNQRLVTHLVGPHSSLQNGGHIDVFAGGVKAMINFGN